MANRCGDRDDAGRILDAKRDEYVRAGRHGEDRDVRVAGAETVRPLEGHFDRRGGLDLDGARRVR